MEVLAIKFLVKKVDFYVIEIFLVTQTKPTFSSILSSSGFLFDFIDAKVSFDSHYSTCL